MLNLNTAKQRNGHTKPKTPAIPITMPGRYSVGNVMAITGWSHSKLCNRISNGEFPAPSYDGKLKYWKTSTLREALDR